MTKTLTPQEHTYTVFAGHRRLATAPLHEMLRATKEHLDAAGEPVLIFDDQTGKQVDFDFTGGVDDVIARNREEPPRSGPGRPRLGVVSREVSLLPRHWEWLEEQPNGISAALRRLVDEARRHEPAAQRARRMVDAIAKFMWSAGGDLPQFEEAARALYAGNQTALEALICEWPADIRDHVLRLAVRVREIEHGGGELG